MTESKEWIRARDQILHGFVGLLPMGHVWTQQERDRWLNLLVQVIDYTIAVVPSSEIGAEVREQFERHV